MSCHRKFLFLIPTAEKLPTWSSDSFLRMHASHRPIQGLPLKTAKLARLWKIGASKRIPLNENMFACQMTMVKCLWTLPQTGYAGKRVAWSAEITLRSDPRFFILRPILIGMVRGADSGNQTGGGYRRRLRSLWQARDDQIRIYMAKRNRNKEQQARYDRGWIPSQLAVGCRPPNLQKTTG